MLFGKQIKVYRKYALNMYKSIDVSLREKFQLLSRSRCRAQNSKCVHCLECEKIEEFPLHCKGSCRCPVFHGFKD